MRISVSLNLSELNLLAPSEFPALIPPWLRHGRTVCVCVCVCVFCVCVYIHTYAYIHTYMHAYMHTYVYIHTYIHIHLGGDKHAAVVAAACLSQHAGGAQASTSSSHLGGDYYRGARKHRHAHNTVFNNKFCLILPYQFLFLEIYVLFICLFVNSFICLQTQAPERARC